MAMEPEQTLLFEQGYFFKINSASNPFYYFFDWDARTAKFNMNFQHFHQFYEIHILLNDRASHIIEGDYYTLQPYDIVMLRPSLLHKTEYPANNIDYHRRLIINFQFPDAPDELGQMVRQALAPFDADVPIYRFDGEVGAEAFGYLNRIFALGKQPLTPLTRLSIHTNFLEFLCVVARHTADNRYESQELSDSITQKVYAVASYIHHHFAQELSLEGLSKKFFISPYYLSHQFRRVTGFSLINYIQMTRVRNAQQLLLYTERKIADITTSCGFTSFSQFNRVFNKFCHVSPSQFRQNGEITPLTILPYEKEPSLGSAAEEGKA